MPIQYPTGTLAEHQACRTDAAAFDVSHLGTVRVDGPRRRSTGCRRRSPTTWARSRPGRTQYTHLLDPDDASVVDDIIVWWVDDERFDVMPNASNTARVRRRHRRRRRDGRPGRDRRPGPAGPRAAGQRVGGGGRGAPAGGGRGRGARARRAWWPAPATRARTASSWPCRPTAAAAVWDAVVAVGRDARRAGRPRHAAARGRACRCTATSSARASRRCRPAWAGWWPGGRATSGATRRCRPSASGAWPAGCAGLEVDGRRPPRADCPVLVDGERRSAS